jgi:hypothetical protein
MSKDNIDFSFEDKPIIEKKKILKEAIKDVVELATVKKETSIRKDEILLTKPQKEDTFDKRQRTAILDDVISSQQKEETDVAKTITLLCDERYKRRKTILYDNKDVFAITTLDVIAQVYDFPILKNWIDWFAEWRTSSDKGIGRRDVVDIMKFTHAERQGERQQMLDLLKGR